MRKIPRFGSLAAMLMVAVLLVAAISTPVLAFAHPCPCYGTVTLDGDPAPVGTVIEIFIGQDGTPSDTYLVEKEGEYLTDVWADSDRDDEELRYTVGGFPALQKGVFGNEGQEIDLTATTGPQPPQVTTNDANPIGHNSATLNGYVDIGEYSPVIVYFEYDGLKTPEMSRVADGAFSYPVTGLNPLTTYNFKAVAEYDTSTVMGNPRSFTTMEGPEWPITIPLNENTWNVISTPVWLDKDYDRSDEILSGDDWDGLRWTGSRWSSLSKSYTWEPLEAFYVTGSDGATFHPMVPEDGEPMVPNDRKLSRDKWALIGSSPVDGKSDMAIGDVLAGLNDNYVNVFIPASGASCTVGNCDGITLQAFSGAWVFVGGESTRTIVGFYGFLPVETD